LFYGPLHFLTISHIVEVLGVQRDSAASIVDLGCGTGVAGAAWALAAGSVPRLTGIDRHPWAVAETRWTYRHFKLAGQAAAGDLAAVPRITPNGAIVAAYALNELSPNARSQVEDRLLRAANAGARVLVVEPIARSITPWWDDFATRVVAAGGRADEWRFAVDLPPLLRLFDKAAGLNHRELTARSLYLGGKAAEGRPDLNVGRDV
jgi:hypothetical protein